MMTRIKVTESRKGIGVGRRQAIQTGIFPEVEFLRIGECWEQNNRDAGLWGGAAFDNSILRQFQLKDQPGIFLDFWYRGRPVSPRASEAFLQCLSVPHAVSEAERTAFLEVISMIAGPQKSSIPQWLGEVHSADVGPLKNKLILAINWTHPKQKRRFLSVFWDGSGNGSVIHEIHFSTSVDIFESNVHYAYEALRSIQWRGDSALPPLSSE
jgi:hypothetical protein